METNLQQMTVTTHTHHWTVPTEIWLTRARSWRSAGKPDATPVSATDHGCAASARAQNWEIKRYGRNCQDYTVTAGPSVCLFEWLSYSGDPHTRKNSSATTSGSLLCNYQNYRNSSSVNSMLSGGIRVARPGETPSNLQALHSESV